MRPVVLALQLFAALLLTPPLAAAADGTHDDELEAYGHSDIFDSPISCRAILEHQFALCDNEDCRAVSLHQQGRCWTGDCRALVLHDVALCESADCRGVIYHSVGMCTTGVCQAMILNSSALCAGIRF